MSTIISIFEDKKTLLKLQAKQALGLCRLKEIIGEQNVQVEADGFVQVLHYVGFYANSDIRIQILPKIFGNHKELNTTEITQMSIELLFRLLRESGFLSVRHLKSLEDISKFDHDIFEILISLFTSELSDLWKKQIIKTYEREEENLPTIKGKINISETITKNSYRPHMHVVQFDSFSPENLLNRVLKTTAARMHKVSKVPINKKNLQRLLAQMEDIPTIEINKDIFDKITFNRLNQSYEWVYKLAKLFYLNVTPGIYSGDTNSFSFLIPLNRLYEYYLYKQLNKHKSLLFQDPCSVLYQKPECQLCTSSRGNTLTIKPDISVINECVKVIATFDAKYKDVQKDGVNVGDIYQMLAYAIGNQCNRIYLVYPRFFGNSSYQDSYEIVVGGEKVSIRILEFNLLQDDPLFSLNIN